MSWMLPFPGVLPHDSEGLRARPLESAKRVAETLPDGNPKHATAPPCLADWTFCRTIGKFSKRDLELLHARERGRAPACRDRHEFYCHAGRNNSTRQPQAIRVLPPRQGC